MFNARLSFTLVSSKKKPSTQVPGGVCWAFAFSLSDDAADADELHFEGIPDQHFVQQHFAAGVVVTVDEPGHDRHALRIECLRVLARQAFDVARRTRRR